MRLKLLFIFVLSLTLLACQESEAVSLHDAVTNKDLELIRKLIEDGADVNGKNAEGRTPFNLAITSDTREVFDEASLYIKIFYNSPAPDIRLRRDNQEILQLLLDNGADIITVRLRHKKNSPHFPEFMV